MIYASHCPRCKSTKLGGDTQELKQCLSCGALWFEPIPNSPQQYFLQSSVREVGFGGEAGGSKSFSLVLDPIYQLPLKDYHALLLRRTYPQLIGDDGLVSLSLKIYPSIGGHFNKSELLWTFSDYPGTIRFGHIEHESDLEQKYEGHQYAYLGFDELQTFVERMYLYLFSRNRSSNPQVKLYTRSTFMPGGIGHHWVKKRFIVPFKDNGRHPKYFRRIGGIDTQVDKDDPYATARLFIPSRLEDNPYLWQEGRGDYEKSLHQLDPVDFARKRGDWDIQRTGRVYHAFTDRNIGPDAHDLNWSEVSGFYHSHDFGAVNHVWGLWAKLHDRYYLVYEEKLPEGTTEARATKIKATWRRFVQPFVVELQAAHPNAKLDEVVKMALSKVVAGYGGAGSEGQYRLDFGHHGVVIRKPATMIKSSEDEIVESQIRHANKLFENGTLMICSNMVHTLDQLENCIRDEKGGILDKAQWHYLDGCVRYFAAGVGRGVFVG